MRLFFSSIIYIQLFTTIARNEQFSTIVTTSAISVIPCVFLQYVLLLSFCNKNVFSMLFLPLLFLLLLFPIFLFLIIILLIGTIFSFLFQFVILLYHLIVRLCISFILHLHYNLITLLSALFRHNFSVLNTKYFITFKYTSHIE